MNTLPDEIRASSKALMAYACSLTRSRTEAYDAVQEAYLKVFAKSQQPTFQVEHLRGLLFTVIRNVIYDQQRQHRTRVCFAFEQTLRAEDAYFSPEHICIAHEDYLQVQEAIDKLPRKTKLALRWVREEGVSYEEVAKKLGIKTHSARRLVERAMVYLEDLKGEVL